MCLENALDRFESAPKRVYSSLEALRKRFRLGSNSQKINRELLFAQLCPALNPRLQQQLGCSVALYYKHFK